MKILAIRGANLASLEGEFELVLDTGPLAEAGVFAICGPTGAGKSTLLDAMCLALFDTAPRLDGHSRVRIGRDPEDDARITTTDPRSILRKGAGDGWAEVDFLGVDEEIYRARWEVRRARGRADGKLQPTVMKLEALGTETRWEGRKTDVRDEIERRLGLSFDQFRRSVLLAQGDFAAFLEADPKDRADLLERMTGTAIYGAISQEAHARAGREKVALDQLEA
ncbi:MAG: AAA family ATPase, partial [Myxococcales bacterium]|nr:AAA family ATPase [Myxococcales bacterium]